MIGNDRLRVFTLYTSIGYIPFLFGVAIFSIGVVILHVALNPYQNALSSLESAASHLTLTNALNSGTTVIAPIIVSLLIVKDRSDPSAVQFPFGVIGGYYRSHI